MASEQPTSLSPQNIKLKGQLQAVGAVPFFEKCLTSSDTGAHGRVVLPKAVAEAQFAQYLEKQGAQLVGEDVDGQTYDFRFRFWLNNQSRMYLIEGCLEMIKKYKLQKGDVIVFARKADGTLVVGGRPAGPEDASKRPAVRQRTNRTEDKGRLAKRRKEGPLTDGIFRALTTPPQATGVIQEGQNYACIIDIAGETYKALFSLEPDAHAAFRAACPLQAQAQIAADTAMQQHVQPPVAAAQPLAQPAQAVAGAAPPTAVGAPAVAGAAPAGAVNGVAGASDLGAAMLGAPAMMHPQQQAGMSGGAPGGVGGMGGGVNVAGAGTMGGPGGAMGGGS